MEVDRICHKVIEALIPSKEISYHVGSVDIVEMLFGVFHQIFEVVMEVVLRKSNI